MFYILFFFQFFWEEGLQRSPGCMGVGSIQIECFVCQAATLQHLKCAADRALSPQRAINPKEHKT